jgi:hypothetical protein
LKQPPFKRLQSSLLNSGVVLPNAPVDHQQRKNFQVRLFDPICRTPQSISIFSQSGKRVV